MNRAFVIKNEAEIANSNKLNLHQRSAIAKETISPLKNNSVRTKWNDQFGLIIKYSSERIEKHNLNAFTKRFLNETGLPKEASPFLIFSKDTDEPCQGIMKITEYFGFLSRDFEKYIVIGSDINGDEIVIDNKDNCRIKILKLENDFSEVFVNSNIEKFANSLIIYQNFIDEVTKIHGENAFLESMFDESQINGLIEKLIKNDKESICAGGFWFHEIETLFCKAES